MEAKLTSHDQMVTHLKRERSNEVFSTHAVDVHTCALCDANCMFHNLFCWKRLRNQHMSSC